MADRAGYSALAPGKVSMTFSISSLLTRESLYLSVVVRASFKMFYPKSCTKCQMYQTCCSRVARLDTHSALNSQKDSRINLQQNHPSFRELQPVLCEQVLLLLASLPAFLLWFWASSSDYELGIRAAALFPALALLISTSRPPTVLSLLSRRLL